MGDKYWHKGTWAAVRILLLLITYHLSLITSPARSIPTINEKKAHEVARQQVLWNDRVCPLATLAQDFLESIYGKSSYKGLSPEQVVYGWLLRPDAWKDEPMIHVPDKDLRERLDIEGEYATFSQLFDDTLGYRLNTLGADLPPHLQQLMKESPAAVELDEKVGMIILLTEGKLIQPRPDNMPPLSYWRVEAEILYNRLPITLIVLSINLIIAIIYIISHRLHRRSQKRL